MFGRKKADVLVVGAGPVGLFSALALAKNDIRVAIVDKEWRTGAHSYALALHPQSLDLLDQLGVLDSVLKKSYPVRRVALYDGTVRRADIQLCDRTGAPSPVAVMRQDVLEHTLEEALRAAGVQVMWNHSVSRLIPGDHGVVASIDKLVKDSVGYGVARTEWMIAKTFNMAVPWVLGADGQHSVVRRMLQFDFAETGPAQHFAVFECQVDGDVGHEMKLNLREDTTDVLWPLPDGRCRWSFQLLDFAGPQEARTKNRLPMEIGSSRFPILDAESLQLFLRERAPWFQHTVQHVDWRIVVRFEQRMATSFGQSRLWLAGDAGHVTGPAGMQSMNVGLREAKQLTDAIIESVRGGDASPQFDAYQHQRLAEWRRLLQVEGELTPTSRAAPWIAQLGQRLLPCLPASGVELDALADQLGLATPFAETKV